MPSAAIARINYDHALSQLTIVFTTGRIYQYSLVPPSLIADFNVARSKGGFFNQHIRDRFPFRDVTPARDATAASNLLDQLKRSAE